MADRPPPSRRMRYSGKTLKIKVPSTLADDEAPEIFTIHEDIIKKNDYFKALFEGSAGEIELGEDPGTISDYIDFIYRNSVSARRFENNTPEEIRASCLRLVHLYIFGEKIDDCDLINVILYELIDLCDKLDDEVTGFLPLKALRVLYEGTNADSSLRDLALYMAVQFAGLSLLEADVEEYHPEFLLELLRAVMRKGDEEGQGDGEGTDDREVVIR